MTSVDTGCFRYLLIKGRVNLFEISIVLSLDIVTLRRRSYKTKSENTSIDNSQCTRRLFNSFRMNNKRNKVI